MIVWMLRSCVHTKKRPGQKDVNLGARYPEAKRISVEEARALRGIGWEGDLQEMRSTRFEKI